MPKSWTRPQFEEVNLGCEIAAKDEYDDDPSFLFTRKTGVRRAPSARAPELQREREHGGHARHDGRAVRVVAT